MSKPDIKFTLEKLKSDFDEAINQAYIDGFNAGSAVDKPTQEEFNEAHREPVGYGEDGEIYVMAGDISSNKAVYLMKSLFDKEGYDYDTIQELSDSIQFTKVAYMPEDITSEAGYCFNRDGRGAYDAWVWTAS